MISSAVAARYRGSSSVLAGCPRISGTARFPSGVNPNTRGCFARRRKKALLVFGIGSGRFAFGFASVATAMMGLAATGLGAVLGAGLGAGATAGGEGSGGVAGVLGEGEGSGGVAGVVCEADSWLAI